MELRDAERRLHWWVEVAEMGDTGAGGNPGLPRNTSRYGLQGGCGVPIVSPPSSLLLRLRYRKKTKAIKARTTRPPKTPPTMPPIGACEAPGLVESVSELGVGVAGIEGVDVVV